MKDTASVANATSGRGVGASECKLCGVVVKAGAGPLGGGVAEGTVGRESGGLMVRIVGLVVLIQVAGRAVAGSSTELIVDVALCAFRLVVGAGESKPGLVVVEVRAFPPVNVVAQGAIGGEAGCLVIRIAGSVVIIEVTGCTGAGETAVLIVDVALRAIGGRVRSKEREPGVRVVEHRSAPLNSGVANRAVTRETSRLVVRIGGAVIVVEVTAGTHLGGTGILVAGMACGAGNGLMRSGQGE